MTIYIHKYKNSLVACHVDRDEPVAVCVDQGFYAPGTILVGRVMSVAAGQCLIDIGGKTPGILFQKPSDDKLVEGQKIPVQIRKTPQKEAFDVKPYEVSALLQMNSPHMTVTPRKTGLQFASDLRDKDWKLATREALEPHCQEMAVHLKAPAYVSDYKILIEEIQNLASKANTIYADDYKEGKPGDLVGGGEPLWLHFCLDQTSDRQHEVIVSDADVAAKGKAAGLPVQYDLKPNWTQQIESMLDDILSPLCQIPGGGLLIIEEGHALTAIDVNTSAGALTSTYTPITISSDHDLFTFAKTALNEAVRQMYLRHVGGIILLDLPRLQNRKHQVALEKHVKSYEGRGLQVLGPTKSGLFEFTKKKEGMSLKQALGAA